MKLGVRNPVPGLETVAIAPFFNLIQDRPVDGREFALAYYSELQKVPGFEVLPAGVAERAIFQNQLQMKGPEDALALAKVLDVDAVVGVRDGDVLAVRREANVAHALEARVRRLEDEREVLRVQHDPLAIVLVPGRHAVATAETDRVALDKDLAREFDLHLRST